LGAKTFLVVYDGENAKGTLTLNSGRIQNGAGNSIIVRNNQGKTIFSGTPKSYTGSTQVMDGVLQIDGGDNILPIGTTLTLGANAMSTLAGNLSLAKAGTGSLTISGTNTMTGQLRIFNGTLALTHASSNNLSQASSFSLEGTTAVLDVRGLANHRLVLAADQSVSGTGTVLGNVAVGASSILAPDLLTINGDYVQTGLLAIDLAGDTQGTDYDWLQVTGSATLDGELEIALSDDFMPHVGDTFQVLTAASITDEGLELVGDLASYFDYRILSSASGAILELYATATLHEPSTLLLALGLLAPAGVFRLRRKAASC